MHDDDLYSILGVPRTATREEIHDAYRKLAAKYHPRRPGEGDPEKARAVHAAWKVLSRHERRLSYDARGSTKLEPIDAHAVRELRQLIALKIDELDPDMDIRVALQEHVSSRKQSAKVGVSAARALIRKLERQRKWIRRRAQKHPHEGNLFDEVIADTIRQQQEKIAEREYIVRLADRMLVLLDDYVWEPQEDGGRAQRLFQTRVDLARRLHGPRRANDDESLW